jgi:two-component system response regulator (stage 0 sporulation protein A)
MIVEFTDDGKVTMSQEDFKTYFSGISYLEFKKAEKVEGISIETDVCEELEPLKIPKSIKGYVYLREAICLVVYDFNEINYMTTGLYPKIARKFETTSSRTERAIRHAIETLYKDSEVRKPRNSEFIAGIADKIIQKRKKVE